MGVPKFYRWISERYPCLSEVIKEYQIPDFDNLYLDMNGIIHTCSHPNDDDPHFRITEEKIFSGICYYIDFLFKMIKPKKVFFMAVDGVAPRAKMNQQRGRRFRTAKAAVILEERAKLIGEDLPAEARFDSNCITPGTVFMARLHEKLKSFVVYKITTDKLWQGVRVFLSGHETPGEGEHKIMDFIRHEKSQPGYDPNKRHCLYGLDADLIMLGLCSHEPHFSLLREEVKFGGKRNQKRILTPEETTFHLLHISLLREYLDYEFNAVKEKIQFEYSIEHIIDDFVLMSFLVGNDFIPNLPQLHIQHDALPMLYQTYIDILPSLGGYINEQGNLNLERFEKFLGKLAEYDFQKFGELNDDFEYLERKSKACHDPEETNKINSSNFLSNLGFSDLAISKTAEFDSSTEDEYENDETEIDESTLELAFTNHKNCYYLNKLEFDNITPEVMREQAEGYVRAIQWNLHYYYNGVVSWSWYYPHHYSPYISDLKNFKEMKIAFELGNPFLPFQQLLAVLPKLSKELLPLSYQKLMCEEDSPLIDYYPDDFETDLNGKQQEWEAVVLIPFINEKLLLKFAVEADKELNKDERERNQHGPHLLYTTADLISPCSVPSFLPGYFPDLQISQAKLSEMPLDYFRLLADEIKKGLCVGVILDKFFKGFPTLKTLKHIAKLCNEKVKVFQMVSQKDNMMLYIKEHTDKDLKTIAQEIVGKTIHVGWPHLRQASVLAVSDGKIRYIFSSSDSGGLKPKEEVMEKNDQNIWKRKVESCEEHFYQRWGIFIGEVKMLVEVKCFTGSRYSLNKEGKVVEEKQWEKTISNYALQTTLANVDIYYPELQSKGVTELFTTGLLVFLLSELNYGCMGTIIDNDLKKHNGKLLIKLDIPTEPDLSVIVRNQHKFLSQEFMSGHIVSQHVGIKSYYISRLTGTFLIQTSPKDCISPNRVNVGLNLKFNKRNEEVCGFSKKKDNQWLYSEEAVKTINQYLTEFADFFEKLLPFIENEVVHLEDIYPDGRGNEIVNKILQWLKAQLCSSAERQKCGMEKLDAGIITAIEEKVNSSAKQNKVCLKAEVSPQDLYSPFLCKGASIPDPSTDFQLFDRVINVCHSSSVPLGLRGTIIGVKSAENENDCMYEVVFDEEFFGGLSINCSAGKGYRMPPSALVNLSHGERVRTGKESPQKRSREAPKLDRNPLFSKAIKNLQTVKTPENSNSIRVLQKNASPQGQPFYKVGLTSSPMSDSFQPNLFFSNIDSSNKQFVTPKANNLHSGSNYSSPSSASSKKLTPNNITPKDYHNLWDDLKNMSSPESSPTKTPIRQSYGRQVSVQELFAGAEKEKRQLQSNSNSFQQLPQHQLLQSNSPSDPRLPQHQLLQSNSPSDPRLSHQQQSKYTSVQLSQHQAQVSHPSPVVALMNYYGTPPLYSHAKYGPLGWSIATITLPDGKTFSSDPFPTDKQATENVAEKALAFLRSKRAKPPVVLPEQHNFVNNLAALQRPIIRPQFPQENIRPFYPNPLCMQNPAIFNSPYPMFDAPLARQPYPMHAAHIPDSFVQQNRLYFQNERPPFSPGYQMENNKILLDNRTQVPAANVVHLPGPFGGTASVRNTNSVKLIERPNAFVPTQVMKKAAKVSEDNSSCLSVSEWPTLAANKNEVSAAPVNNITHKKESPKGQTNETTSFASKVRSSIENTSNIVKPASSEATTKPVVLKPKKKRIAANFSNT